VRGSGSAFGFLGALVAGNDGVDELGQLFSVDVPRLEGLAGLDVSKAMGAAQAFLDVVIGHQPLVLAFGHPRLLVLLRRPRLKLSL
jgi:hypothetical protein